MNNSSLPSTVPSLLTMQRILSIPLFLGCFFFACGSLYSLVETISGKIDQPWPVCGCLAATCSLGSLAVSLVSGRGVPTWIMRSVVVATLTFFGFAAWLIVRDWWTGKPGMDELAAMAISAAIPLLVCDPLHTLKKMWNHRQLPS